MSCCRTLRIPLWRNPYIVLWHVHPCRFTVSVCQYSRSVNPVILHSWVRYHRVLVSFTVSDFDQRKRTVRNVSMQMHCSAFAAPTALLLRYTCDMHACLLCLHTWCVARPSFLLRTCRQCLMSSTMLSNFRLLHSAAEWGQPSENSLFQYSIDVKLAYQICMCQKSIVIVMIDPRRHTLIDVGNTSVRSDTDDTIAMELSPKRIM